MKQIIFLLILILSAFISSFGQNVFRPIEATIYDDNGRFSSTNFDCPSMLVKDNQTSVQITIAGDKMTLYPSRNKDVYKAFVRQKNVEIQVVAYRSTNSNKIYLVVITTKNGDKSVTINFKQ